MKNLCRFTIDLGKFYMSFPRGRHSTPRTHIYRQGLEDKKMKRKRGENLRWSHTHKASAECINKILGFILVLATGKNNNGIFFTCEKWYFIYLTKFSNAIYIHCIKKYRSIHVQKLILNSCDYHPHPRFRPGDKLTLIREIIFAQLY